MAVWFTFAWFSFLGGDFFVVCFSLGFLSVVTLGETK